MCLDFGLTLDHEAFSTVPGVYQPVAPPARAGVLP